MKHSLMASVVITLLVGIGFQVYAERNPHLPPPYETPSIPNPSTVIGWPSGVMPTAPSGYTVSALTEIDSPRSMYVLPDGDILVSQSKRSPDDGGKDSPNLITILHMNGSSLDSKEVFLKDVELPFGMAISNGEFFVGTPTQVLAYPYDGTEITGDPRTVVTLPFPAPQRHWTRHLLFNEDQSKLYISVGSVSNVGEDNDPLDPKTAAILEVNPDGTGERIFANGLRNPVSMAWEPKSKRLWTVVNERDELGDFLPPDYITRVEEGGFYGWPYAYWGKNEDPRRKGERPDLVARSLTPNFAVGAHTASLGITFTTGTRVPEAINEGALITQHGSWNSSSLVGYKVIYVPFKDGEAIDGEKDFLTGFIADLATNKVYGRPVASVILADGTILVSDDGGDRIWKISPPKTKKK
jgi:Glucose/sorbosone dehydrogenases